LIYIQAISRYSWIWKKRNGRYRNRNCPESGQF